MRARSAMHSPSADIGKEDMARVWFITGGSRGIRRSLAEAVLAAGHRVVATARDPSTLSDLVRDHGNAIRAVPVDVTDEAAVHAAMRAGLDAFGRLDVVVNNAGYGDLAPIENTPLSAFR